MIRLKVREVAIAKGYNQYRLAKEADMAYKTVQAIWHNPEHEVTTITLNKLAKTLGVKPEELIEYIPD